MEDGDGGGDGRLAEGAFGGGVENAEGGAAAAWLWTVTKPWGGDHAADRGEAEVGGLAGAFAVLCGRVASIPDLGEHVGQNAGARVLDLPHERWAGAGAGHGAHGEVVEDEVFRAEGEGAAAEQGVAGGDQRLRRPGWIWVGLAVMDQRLGPMQVSPRMLGGKVSPVTVLRSRRSGATWTWRASPPTPRGEAADLADEGGAAPGAFFEYRAEPEIAGGGDVRAE